MGSCLFADTVICVSPRPDCGESAHLLGARQTDRQISAVRRGTRALCVSEGAPPRGVHRAAAPLVTRGAYQDVEFVTLSGPASGCGLCLSFSAALVRCGVGAALTAVTAARRSSCHSRGGCDSSTAMTSRQTPPVRSPVDEPAVAVRRLPPARRSVYFRLPVYHPVCVVPVGVLCVMGSLLAGCRGGHTVRRQLGAEDRRRGPC